jgi:hypothetical protein
LSYKNFDEIMPDVERLLKGNTTVGQWSLAEICNHLATVMRRVADAPASTPIDPSKWVSEEQKRRVFDSGMLPEGLPSTQENLPANVGSTADEAERLRKTIAHYKASSGPVIAHRLFGPLSKPEWDRLQLIHFAHHLSFAVPTAG